jgi:hypothetical protein
MPSEAAPTDREALACQHALAWQQIEPSGNVFRHQYQYVAESLVWTTAVERMAELADAANSAFSGEPSSNHEPI